MSALYGLLIAAEVVAIILLIPVALFAGFIWGFMLCTGLSFNELFGAIR
jgi:uncharacterized protein YneF (UPF0154 family)